MTELLGDSNIIMSDGTGPVVGSEVNDTVDFAGAAENATGGAFTGIIVDLDVNSAGANGTPSQDGAILNVPPAAGGVQIGDLSVTDIENVIGSDFNDGLFGNNEVNVLIGGAGNDIIHGFAGNDFLSGGAGTDTVLFSAAPAGVVVDLSAQISDEDFTAGNLGTGFAATGGAGSNVLAGFENVVGSQSADDITGDDNNNLLNGNGGADTLSGGAGDDTLVSDAQDVLDGGTGNDTVNFSGAAENATGGAFNGVIIDLDVNSAGANGTPSQFGAILNVPPAAGGVQIGDLSVTDVENVIGTNFNDGLFGNNEVNILSGGAGNDIIHGFAGNDFLSGGAGTDTVLFSAAPAGVVVNLGDQISEEDFAAGNFGTVFAATGGAGSNVLAGFENVTGSQSADDITGDSNANTLNGNGGNDVLFGLGGADTLLGGAGDDILAGGGGTDVIDGGAGIDTNSFEGINFAVTANLSNGTALYVTPFGVVFEQFTNIENLSGTELGDSLTGSAAADGLAGNGGDDTLRGLGGNDDLDGGDGNDAIFAGSGSDNVAGGAGDDRIFAGSGDDVIDAGAGDDFVVAGSGADIISAGAGDDLLAGGLGADTFVFADEPGDNRIFDFSFNDVIDISAFGFSDLADVVAASEAVGGGVVITLDDDTSLTLDGVSVGDLTASDFIF